MLVSLRPLLSCLDGAVLYREKNGDEATNYRLMLRSDWQVPIPDPPLVGAHGLRSYKRFTPILDQILDELLPDLTLGELKVLLYIRALLLPPGKGVARILVESYAQKSQIGEREREALEIALATVLGRKVEVDLSWES